MMVEELTDNRNRTVGEVRAALTKYGGSLGETNSVSFQFDRVGSISYPATAGSADDVFEAALEAGADDVETSEAGHEISGAPDDLHAVREALENRLGAAERAGLVWRPQATVPVADDKLETLFKLIEALDDSDDVQTVSANYEVSEDALAKLTV